MLHCKMIYNQLTIDLNILLMLSILKRLSAPNVATADFAGIRDASLKAPVSDYPSPITL